MKLKTKKLLKVGTSAMVLALAMTATSAHAKDACRTVLCMSGMVQGEGVVDNCRSAVNDYFNIIERKRGKFSASRTARARLSFLNSCPNHSGWASRINDQYGRMRSFGF